MTEDRDFKQHVRARMDATGAPYTKARTDLLDGGRVAAHLTSAHDLVVRPEELAELVDRLDEAVEGGWLVEVHGKRASDGQHHEVVIAPDELRSLLR